MISQSHCHTSVTSDDMVTVIVTSYKITEKKVEDSKKNDVIQCVEYMLILRQTYGYLE